MTKDPASSNTPSRPIRPDGEIPDSQDDDFCQSDFEDLLEETPAPAPRYVVKDHSTRLIQVGREEMAKAQATAKAEDMAAIEELSKVEEKTKVEKDKTKDSEVSSSKLKTRPTSTPAFPLPSTAAHTLLITTPPVLSTAQLESPQTAIPIPIQSEPPSQLTTTNNPKHLRLHQQIADLQTKIADAQSQLTLTNAKLAHPEQADSIVKAHIKLLHDYNEIKDVGLMLMGLIADGRGVRLGGVMAEFGVSNKD